VIVGRTSAIVVLLVFATLPARAATQQAVTQAVSPLFLAAEALGP
jgi:hypothetical protein